MEGDSAQFKWQDGVGVVGVLLAVAATDMPILFRLGCFTGCAICLTLAFSSHKNWPISRRWLFSIAAVLSMIFVAWNAWEASRPKIIKDVFIEWRQPPPMEFGTSLGDRQLNAVAKTDGMEVSGSYIYNPALGSTPLVGMDTLSVEFTPKDPTKFKAAKETITVLVRAATPTITAAPPAKPPKLRPRSTNPPGTKGNTLGGSGDCQANAIGGSATITNCGVNDPNQSSPSHYAPGGQLITGSATDRSMYGGESSVYEQMDKARTVADWKRMVSLSEAEMRSHPDWLTPYAWAALAHWQLCDPEDATKLADFYLSKVSKYPDYMEWPGTEVIRTRRPYMGGLVPSCRGFTPQ